MNAGDADETVRRVHEVIEREVHVDVGTPDTDLVEEGLLDSLALVSLIVALEAEFGVIVDLDEFDPDDFRTVSAMAAYVRQQNSPSNLVT
ncbi:acyl carrier protein [Actinomycetospora sp. CA-084318]|uniref:acyl carrier protein n=1 Tax=Actinomycetospora sp. CA-084318 TaxID=3239892 RepID=UPI003D96DECF